MLDRQRPILITGAGGQDGLLLARQLDKAGYKTIGLLNRESQIENFSRFAPNGIPRIGDIRDTENLRKIIETYQPCAIANLAGLSSVELSWKEVSSTLSINALAVGGILEIVRDRKLAGDSIVFYQASTSEIYGSLKGKPGESEIFPMKPTSPYAISKVAAHEISQSFRSAFDLDVRIGILFNHESPLREPTFLTRKISQGVANISAGRQNHLELGDLSICRDWGYAVDFATAIHLMLEMEERKDFVVSTGESASIQDLLTFAFNHVGISDWKAYVKTSPKFIRPIENPPVIGDSGEIRKQLGWLPTKSIEQVICEMVDYDSKLLSGVDPSISWMPDDIDQDA